MRYHFIFIIFKSNPFFCCLSMAKELHKMQMTVCSSVASEKVLHKTVSKCAFFFFFMSVFFFILEHISTALTWIDLQNFEQSQITKSCERILCARTYTHTDKLARKTTIEVKTFWTILVCVCVNIQVFFWNMSIAFGALRNEKKKKRNRKRNYASTSTLWFLYHNYI